MTEIINLIIGGALTLSGVVLANYLNNKNERKRNKKKLESELIQICSKISTAYGKLHLYDINCKVFYKLFDLNNKMEYKSLADSFLERGLDATMEYIDLLAQLLSQLIDLYHYSNKEDIEFLKSRYEELKKLKYKEYNFNDAKDENQIRERQKTELKELLVYLKTTRVYIIMDEMKKKLSPHT